MEEANERSGHSNAIEFLSKMVTNSKEILRVYQ